MAAENRAAETLDHADHVRKLVAYFEDTKRDYRLWWMTSTALAMHFGYYYEKTRHHAEALVNMNRELATRAGLQGGDRVLDAGCGVGGSTIWLARELGTRVVGVNVVPGDVERGRGYARRRNVADLVTFELQDMTRTNFPDESFDVVWAIESSWPRPVGCSNLAAGWSSPTRSATDDRSALRTSGCCTTGCPPGPYP